MNEGTSKRTNERKVCLDSGLSKSLGVQCVGVLFTSPTPLPHWESGRKLMKSNHLLPPPHPTAFAYAHAFNGDVSSWDVSSVTNMESMFRDASSFNQNIGDWDVSNVTNMDYMFYGATNFDLFVPSDLSGWCVQNIPSLPSWFAVNSSLENDHYPIWGTCP